MASSTTSRRDAIRASQNQLLYGGVLFSVVCSPTAGAVVLSIFYEHLDAVLAWSWFAALCAVYAARWVDYRLYLRCTDDESQPRHWQIRFNTGAMLSGGVWASSLLMIYPLDSQPLQGLLVLTLGAVAASALASLPYDRDLCRAFQLLLLVSVEARLLLIGDTYSLQLAIFSLFIFGFLLSCGELVGRNYLELVRLKRDAQDNNLMLIRTTEQMARTGYWQWDQASNTVVLSENLALMWGFSRRQVGVRDCFRLLHRDDRRRVRRALAAMMSEERETTVEHRIADPAKKQIADMRQVIKPMRDSLEATYWLGTVQDISDIRAAEETIYKMAYFDELTGLANRANFHERLQAAITEATRLQQQFCAIYIDLDDFKGVNDSFGHECGDGYLQAFADHLQNCTRRCDLTARLGGDEFCVLLHDTEGEAEASSIAERILAFSLQAIQIGNHQIFPKLSIGIAQFPQHGTQPDQIVKSADLAMYNVKRNGKHDFAFYNSRMGEDSLETARLESDFRMALEGEQFELWYQPKIDLRDNCISGVEALIRWRHPERGIVPPDVFINVAERVGMIKDIGEWVLQTACLQLAQWKLDGHRLQMAVNISGIHLTSQGFCDYVETTVKSHGLERGDLEIEITESLSRDPDEHYRICHELRKAGVRVAIDDFGTGYSSLSVLQRLEVDVLKIDRSFINDLPHSASACLLVKAMIEMSIGLGYELVAEGVENQEQLDFLRDLKCTYIQGYFFSKPLMSEEMLVLLKADLAVLRAA